MAFVFRNMTAVPQGFRSIVEKFDPRCVVVAPGDVLILEVEEANADVVALRQIPAFKELKD